MRPAIAEAATVYGDARYSCPGPERPGKFRLIAEIVGFTGSLTWDASKPDGTPRKLLDIEKIKSLGWSPPLFLRAAIARTYEWFQRAG